MQLALNSCYETVAPKKSSMIYLLIFSPFRYYGFTSAHDPGKPDRAAAAAARPEPRCIPQTAVLIIRIEKILKIGFISESRKEEYLNLLLSPSAPDPGPHRRPLVAWAGGESLGVVHGPAQAQLPANHVGFFHAPERRINLTLIN